MVTIHAAGITLSGLRPVINGTALLAEPQIADDVLRFPLPSISPDAALVVETASDASGITRLRYALHNVPAAFVLDSFGIRFDHLSNVRTFLRSGYFSWDGTYYVPIEDLPVDAQLRGYAFTQLLPLNGTGALVLGFDRHDRFQQPFTLKRSTQGFALAIETLWDQKARSEADMPTSETLHIFSGASVEETLRDWARAVAAAMSPRLSTPPINGWCSWYNLYAYIDEQNILDHLHAARQAADRDQLPMWLFQLDDGFTPEMGDWLDVKPQFPRGMKPLLEDIRAAGFTPGLWIAPFMVGNRSRLFRDHPDWVVRDRHSGQPLAHMTFYAEFRWHKRSEEYYILDTTHPEAFAYLRQVFRTWHHEWGCDYFKTDFMHFGSEHGPDRALWHTPGLSRIEIWRRTAAMIRDEIGDAVWLGCGCPLWASVGLVDAIRIGRDMGVEWDGSSASAQALLRDQSTRNFANGILWQSDPDCILLRDRFHHLSAAELEALAIFAGMSAGLRVTSDHLGELSPQRLALWKMLLSLEDGLCHYPLLGQSPLTMTLPANAPPRIHALDPVLVQVRRPHDPAAPIAVFILNTGEATVQRSYPLELLGLPAPLLAQQWSGAERRSAPQPLHRLELTLPPHSGSLWFLRLN